MSTKLRSVNRNGLVWLVADFTNRAGQQVRRWLHPQGTAGNCQPWAGERIK